MDGVKVALGNRRMTVEAARQCAKDRKEWRALLHMQLDEFHAAIFASYCVFFLTALSYSGGYHLEMGGIPLHGAVGINCKRAQLLKIKVQESSIWVKGCILMIVCVCVCVCGIRLDMTNHS